MPGQRAVGRPPINDDLEIVLFVEIGRRRRGQKVRQFCALRTTKYWGAGSIEPNGEGGFTVNYDRSNPLQGEALRRRYAKARQALMAGRPSEAERAIAYNPIVVNEVRAMIDKMVDDFLTT